MKLPPRLQENLLRQIVHVALRHARQEHGMHHPEEPAVQLPESVGIAAARSADQVPQFAALVRDDALLPPRYLKLLFDWSLML